MTYEYDFAMLDIDEQEMTLIHINMGSIDKLNVKIKTILNERAKEGWEPLYPFSVPQLWFKRIAKKKR